MIKRIQLKVPATRKQRAIKTAKPRKSATTIPLRDAAYEAIKRRIITCALKPGEYVNEMQLSTALRIGRTPVHQALDRLMHDGLVEVIPRKGVIVKPLSLNEVLEVTEIRLLNETYCVRLAAERASDEDIVFLRDLLKQAKRAASTRDVEQIMLVDRQFHLRLAQMSRNDIFEDLLANLIERSLRFWFISMNAPRHFESVHEDHEAIVAALAKHDPDAAEDIMRRHIESFRGTLGQYI